MQTSCQIITKRCTGECNRILEETIANFYFKQKTKTYFPNCIKCYNNKTNKNRKTYSREEKILKGIIRRARDKNLECDLKLSDIIIPKLCPVLNIPLDESTWKNVPTPDRWDNSKGYTKNNTFIISFWANTIKRDATVNELKRVYEYSLKKI